MREQARQMGDQARQTAQELKESAQDWTEQAKDRLRYAGSAADDYLHDNPWTTVIVVAAAALTLGFLLGRRD